MDGWVSALRDWEQLAALVCMYVCMYVCIYKQRKERNSLASLCPPLSIPFQLGIYSTTEILYCFSDLFIHSLIYIKTDTKRLNLNNHLSIYTSSLPYPTLPYLNRPSYLHIYLSTYLLTYLLTYPLTYLLKKSSRQRVPAVLQETEDATTRLELLVSQLVSQLVQTIDS